MFSPGGLRSALLWSLLICAPSAFAQVGDVGSGFIGYGITMYKPTCATACRTSVSNPLDCDGHAAGAHRKRMGGMSMEKPTPECYATNDAYLQTVAYCISTHCEDVELWELEQWWTRRMTGRAEHLPKPKESYSETLARITTPPNSTTPSDEMLMDTSLVDEDTYLANYNGNGAFERNEATHVRYGLILLLTGAGFPILLSLLRFIPFPKAWLSRFNAAFIDAPAFGTSHQVPIFKKTFIVPTRGQALFIAYLWTINVVLSSVGYVSRQPSSWFETTTAELATYISYRTGILSFANLALLVLYSTRNNVLLWVTNWSHSTFLLLHRWLAVICTLQACVHSAILLQVYVANGTHATESQTPGWIWGVVATLGLVILLPTSILPIRQKMYELFLAWHVVLSFLVLIGCFYHVTLYFGYKWGYETWIYIAFAIWGFDRLMRVLRVARNGIRTGRVTIVDDDYVQLDFPGVSASGVAYLYFPTLTWRVWENHPFSIASSLTGPTSTRSLADQQPKVLPGEKAMLEDVQSVDSQNASSARSPSREEQQSQLKVGLTFFIRTHTGLTSQLRQRKTLPCLVESSYGNNIFGDHGSRNLASYPNLVCIAGGVGITAVLPFLQGHAGRAKLYWGVRTPALVDAMRDTLDAPVYSEVEMEISQGDRLDLQSILERDIRRGADLGVGTAVVVSGPASMADVVRNIVSQLARKECGAVVAFVEESYSW